MLASAWVPEVVPPPSAAAFDQLYVNQGLKQTNQNQHMIAYPVDIYLAMYHSI
jgi:hypothetical protein